MADAGAVALNSDGSWVLASDGSVELTDSDGACPGYAMTPCSGGDATLSLRDADNSDGATTGDVVLYSVDSTCYALGCRACLTPTSGAASKVSGCDACGSPCGQCGFGTSFAVTFAGITVCACLNDGGGFYEHSDDPNGTWTVNNGGMGCTFQNVMTVFRYEYTDSMCTVRSITPPTAWETDVTVSTVAGVTTIQVDITNALSEFLFSGVGTFDAATCAAHGPFVINNSLGACSANNVLGNGGTATVTP